MFTLEERLVRSRDKKQQQENQRRIEEQREREAKRKLDTRRKIIVGGLVCKHFPEALQFQPRRTEAENEIEFALLDAVLSLIARDGDYLSRIIEEAKASLSEVRLE